MADIEDVYLALDELRREIRERLPDVPADTPPTRRTRLTKDDVLAGFLAGQMKGSPEHHSINLKTNAKHEVQIDVTVRAAPDTEFATPAEAFTEACRLLVLARQTFALAGIPVTPSQGVEGGEQP